MTEEDFLSHHWQDGEKYYTIEYDLFKATQVGTGCGGLLEFDINVPTGVVVHRYTEKRKGYLEYITQMYSSCDDIYLNLDDAEKALEEEKAKTGWKVARRLSKLKEFIKAIEDIYPKYNLRKPDENVQR